MKKTKLGKRFFDSTRGRIVTFLRGNTLTVNDLAKELNLTDNAVRAHLLSLERDGLVHHSGFQTGHRKPHFTYTLTPEADNLFPKSYDTLLNAFIAVLKEKLSSVKLKKTFQDVGHLLSDGQKSGRKNESLENRAERGLDALKTLGGNAAIDKTDGIMLIKSETCPFSNIVAEHPEACHIAETFVADITGAAVKEICEKTKTPRCRFEISGKKN